MRLVLAFLIIFFELNAGATERTPCNLRALVAASREQLPQNRQVIRTSDGRGYINPALPPLNLDYADEERRRAEMIRPVPPRTQAEIEAVFNEVRNLLIQEISAGLPVEQQGLFDWARNWAQHRFVQPIGHLSSLRESWHTNGLGFSRDGGCRADLASSL